MYRVKSELTVAGSGDDRATARYTGMDNYIFVVWGFQMTELKSLIIIEKFSMFKFIVQNLYDILTSEKNGGVAVIWFYMLNLQYKFSVYFPWNWSISIYIHWIGNILLFLWFLVFNYKSVRINE